MMMIFCAIGKGREQQHLLTIPINHIFLRARRQSIKKGIKIAARKYSFCRHSTEQNMVHLKEMASKSSFQMLHAATVEGL